MEEKTVEFPKSVKISEESAEEQLQAFFDFYFVNPNDLEIENGPETVNTIRNTLIRAIIKGHVSIDAYPKLEITQNLINPLDMKNGVLSEIKYLDKLGVAGIARDKSGSVETQRMNAYMGALSGVPANVFLKLEGADMTIMTRIAMLFTLV